MLPIVKFYKSISGADIAFVDGGIGADTITQVAAQFVIAGFVAGDVITVSGSGSNDGDYTIVSLTAGVITLATGMLTDEVAGAAVTIDTEASGIYDFGNCDAGGYKPNTTGLIIYLYNDKAGAGSDDMTDIRISVRDADGGEDEIWTQQSWIEIKSSGGTATVDDAMTAFVKVGMNHELSLGDIQSTKYRMLYIRLHTPTDAEEQNITFQIRAKYQDSATDLVEVVYLHFQDLRAADNDYIHAAITGNGAEQEITAGITNPDYPRNASATMTNIATPGGVLGLEGINNLGQSATESLTLIPANIVYGNVAWSSLTKIIVPAGISNSDNVRVGISDKIGLITAIDNVLNVFKKKVNNEDKTDEITGNVSKVYHTLDCGVIVANEDMGIWYIGRA